MVTHDRSFISINPSAQLFSPNPTNAESSSPGAGIPNHRITHQPFSGKAENFRTADGGVYTGDIKTGLRHGRGRHRYPDGESVYDGEWVRDRCEGRGKFEDAESGFEGEWAAGKKHGRGTEKWTEDGSVYVGRRGIEVVFVVGPRMSS